DGHVQRAVLVDDGAAGDGQTGGVDRVGDGLGRHAALGQRVLVRGDLHDLFRSTDHHDTGDAVDALELRDDGGVQAVGELGGLQIGGDRQHGGRDVTGPAGDHVRFGALG